MPIFVGLDCGGSSSRVLAVDEAGTTVFRGQSGPANLLATPSEALERNLGRAADGCPPVQAVCGAFAGLVGTVERARAVSLLQALFPGASVRAVPDYAAAHAAAPHGTQVTVIAGTGSLVCGPDRHRTLVKTGGGGYLLGDEGSGFRFGRAALRRYIHRPEDCTAVLSGAVERAFGTCDPAAVVRSVYAAPSPQASVARLLPAFAADLDAGEAYAVEVAAREETELADRVATHVETHLADPQRVVLALAGGVWSASSRFEVAFRQALAARLSNSSVGIGRVVRPPVQGAVELAKEQWNGNRE